MLVHLSISLLALIAALAHVAFLARRLSPCLGLDRDVACIAGMLTVGVPERHQMLDETDAPPDRHSSVAALSGEGVECFRSQKGGQPFVESQLDFRAQTL